MIDFNCEGRPFIQIPGDNLTLSSFMPDPIEGYEAPVDFPNCCPFHKEAFAIAQRWFDKFPNCCKNHTEAFRKWHLKKSDYDGLPLKVLKCLSYTEHHISTRIGIPEWYEDITNYIDYIFWSFGHPNIGLHKYSDLLIQFLKVSTSKMPQAKRKRLIEYVEDYHKPRKEATKFDLNVIYDTFQKWVKTFPFDLSYFQGLKAQFERKIPAFKEPARYNPYLGTAKAKAVSQPELILFLDALTKRLISEVQTHNFEIADMKQHRLKLENESLRVGTDELVKGYSKGELKYVTTIKKWLELQKAYFKAVVEITKGSRKSEPKDRAKSKGNEDLPSLEDALVSPERLPTLFTWLLKRQGEREWFDKNGFIGTSERSAAILLGLADGWRMALQIKPPLSEIQLYHVLCQRYNVLPTPEPHKARKGHNYRDVKGWVIEYFKKG